MGHFDDALALLSHADDQLAAIKAEYDKSLHDRAVKPQLLVEIKNFMENLRSALDFTAHGLFAKYGSSSQAHPKIYFPYATLAQGRAEFLEGLALRIPGLAKARPDIVAKLESWQHFADPANGWLPSFMDLNNENKHQQLTPQVRKESKELRLRSRGGEVAIGPGASIILGPGASMRVGDMVIPGPQAFDSGTAPSTVGPGQKTIITWVSFHFASNNEAVIPFLSKALLGVKRIVAELSSI